MPSVGSADPRTVRRRRGGHAGRPSDRAAHPVVRVHHPARPVERLMGYTVSGSGRGATSVLRNGQVVASFYGSTSFKRAWAYAAWMNRGENEMGLPSVPIGSLGDVAGSPEGRDRPGRPILDQRGGVLLPCDVCGQRRAFHNPGERCDAMTGPCACGAWHRVGDHVCSSCRAESRGRAARLQNGPSGLDTYTPRHPAPLVEQAKTPPRQGGDRGFEPRTVRQILTRFLCALGRTSPNL